MVSRFLLLLIAAFCAALTAHPAFAADWLEGESERFVVTARLDEAELRDVIQHMEDFQRILDAQLPPQTQPIRKKRIFLEEDAATISSVSSLRVSGIAIDTPELTGSYSQYQPGDDRFNRYQSIFHALAALHIENAYIRPSAWWVRQGGAIFFKTAYRDEAGNFIIGAPEIRRPLREKIRSSQIANLLLIDSTPRSQSQFEDFSLISRETATALLINSENTGVMEAYLDAFAQGAPLEEAGAILGDLDALARQINLRASSATKSVIQLPLPERPEVGVEFRALGGDEIALIQLRVERLRDERRERTARRLGSLTEQHPDSAEVWYEYAAAEYALVQEADFGGEAVFRGFGFSNGELIVTSRRYPDAKAWDAVNRALELNPDLTLAIRLKADILMARLLRAADGDAAEGFAEVRAMLTPLAQNPEAEPFAAAVLFQSYVEEGVEPPPSALDGLGRAFVSNPGIEAFRYAYAVALSRRGEKDAARKLLVSMLNTPDYRDAAQRALDAAPAM